jgi:methylenetetrahydrofolate reductase (NADPH)
MTVRPAAAPLYSLEFFPPKTEEGVAKLRAARRDFAALKPAFCSVTFGAGGSTREGTLATVLEIRAEGMEGAPHLSCIGGTREGIRDVLERYRSHGIRHLIALRGDLPSGSADVGEFRYANELVEFIRRETGDWFHVDVAAYPEYHPQSRNADDDVASFERKIRAGADSAITQYFFNADAYWSFVDACAARGLDVPIVPGIMPISSFTKLARFSDACGAEIPRWIRRRLEGFGDDTASIRAFGLDVVTKMCASLLERGAPGLHFYTLNQPTLTATIWRALGLAKTVSEVQPPVSEV